MRVGSGYVSIRVGSGYRVQSHRNRDRSLGLDRLSVAVDLYRDGSGGYLVKKPSQEWMDQMIRVSQSNYGRVTIVIYPELSLGYNDQVGIDISVFPGSMEGKVGGHGEDLRDPINLQKLPQYAWNEDGIFALRTNLVDAIALHRALGRVIENAKKLTAVERRKKKKAEADRRKAFSGRTTSLDVWPIQDV